MIAPEPSDGSCGGQVQFIFSRYRLAHFLTQLVRIGLFLGAMPTAQACGEAGGTCSAIIAAVNAGTVTLMTALAAAFAISAPAQEAVEKTGEEKQKGMWIGRKTGSRAGFDVRTFRCVRY